MPGSSFLTHLAASLGARPEILAAESLAWMLTGMPAARAALADVCAIAAPKMPSDLRFRVEQRAGADAGALLVGQDGDAATRIIVEPRFWSALPSDEPARSIERLARDRASALLVLAPASRFTPLWAELRRRCRAADLPLHADRALGEPVRWTRFGPHRTLILASWMGLLATVRARLDAAGEQQIATEVAQLAALCEQQDGDAFLPLAADELSTVSPRRLTQLYRLLDDLVQACEQRSLGVAEGRLTVEERGGYAHRLRLGGGSLVLCVSPERWATLRETPFWLLVYDADGQPAARAEGRLEALASEIPPRLLLDAATGCPLVPLFPAFEVAPEAVLDGLARDVEAVVRLLGEGPTAGFGSAPR